MDKETPEIIDGQILIDMSGQECVVSPVGTFPVVGTLNSETTPEDFARFAQIASRFWRRLEQAADN